MKPEADAGHETIVRSLVRRMVRRGAAGLLRTVAGVDGREEKEFPRIRIDGANLDKDWLPPSVNGAVNRGICI